MPPVPRRESVFQQLSRSGAVAGLRQRTGSQRIYEEIGTWHEVGSEADSGYYPDWGPGYFAPQYMLDSAGIVHLRGVAVRDAPGIDVDSDNVLFLPPDLLPEGDTSTFPYRFGVGRDSGNVSSSAILGGVAEPRGLSIERNFSGVSTSLPALKSGEAGLVDLSGVSWVRAR